MPWTESRTRDEWLAEVTRRGERIRTRRRMALSAALGTALLVPAIGLVSLSARGDGDRQVQVAAGGPAPATGAADAEPPSVLGGSEVVAPALPADAAGANLSSEAIAGPGVERIAPGQPTTTEVHRRISAINGSPTPGPAQVTSTTRVAGEPIAPPPAGGGVVGSTPGASTSSAAGGTIGQPVQGGTSLAACPVAEVRVTVTTDKTAYARGETVRFSSTLENRSATACMVSGRAFFSVEDGAGKSVGSFAYTANFMMPVKAEPGQTFTNSASWDQQDCSGSACVQVPPGTYTVIAGWTEGGAYIGRGSFQISA